MCGWTADLKEVRFGWNGKWYDTFLCGPHRLELCDPIVSMVPYAHESRAVNRASLRSATARGIFIPTSIMDTIARASAPRRSTSYDEIRKWAQDHRIPVSNKGPVSEKVVDLFYKANPDAPPLAHIQRRRRVPEHIRQAWLERRR